MSLTSFFQSAFLLAKPFNFTLVLFLSYFWSTQRLDIGFELRESHCLYKIYLSSFVKVHLKQNFKKERFLHSQLPWVLQLWDRMPILTIIPIKLYSFFFALLQSSIGFPYLELNFHLLCMGFGIITNEIVQGLYLLLWHGDKLLLVGEVKLGDGICRRVECNEKV